MSLKKIEFIVQSSSFFTFLERHVRFPIDWILKRKEKHKYYCSIYVMYVPFLPTMVASSHLDSFSLLFMLPLVCVRLLLYYNI